MNVYRKVLTSAAEGVRETLIKITPEIADVPGDPSWSVTLRTLHGGKQEGVDLVTIDNGALLIDLVPTRGMSLLEVRHGDLRLGWNSPVKEVVHPKWLDLASRGGLGWLEGFNEFVVRCGLEYAGAPGRDEFIDNTGGKAEMDLTLHGRIGNLPASEVIVTVDRQPPHQICVRGKVHERQFYGPDLELVAEVTTEPGSDSFQIADKVINHSDHEQEFELIYHSNYGSPLLEQGAAVSLPAKSVTPINARASEGLDDYATYLRPTPGYTEQVYLIEPYADDQQETVALLQNAKGDRGASIRWQTAELPCFTLWKNTAPEATGYVTGLEPGTCFPFNRKTERKNGRLPTLAPGESRQFKLAYGMHGTTEKVSEVRRVIEAIQAGRETHLVVNPPA